MFQVPFGQEQMGRILITSQQLQQVWPAHLQFKSSEQLMHGSRNNSCQRVLLPRHGSIFRPLAFHGECFTSASLSIPAKMQHSPPSTCTQVRKGVCCATKSQHSWKVFDGWCFDGVASSKVSSLLVNLLVQKVLQTHVCSCLGLAMTELYSRKYSAVVSHQHFVEDGHNHWLVHLNLLGSCPKDLVKGESLGGCRWYWSLFDSDFFLVTVQADNIVGALLLLRCIQRPGKQGSALTAFDSPKENDNILERSNSTQRNWGRCQSDFVMLQYKFHNHCAWFGVAMQRCK